MALQLEQLVFSVETGALDDARIKIAKLGDAVNSLNKPLQDMQRSSAKTAEAIAKSELAAEKARVAKEKLSAAVEDTGESMSRTEKYLERLSTSMKIFRGEVLNTQGGTLELGENFTRGQASALAYQMQLGATADQLKAIATEFKALNSFSNTNPFDKSTRGLSSLRQEISELQMVDKFMRDGIALTRDQIVNLAKDSERLTQAYRSMKKPQEELDVELIKLTEQTIEAARVKNALVQAAKESQLQAEREAQAIRDEEKARQIANAEIEKQMALYRSSVWKEWSSTIGQTSKELQDMAQYYRDLNAQSEKQMQMLRQGTWKEWAGNVGKASDEMQQLNQYFSNMETEALQAEAALNKLHTTMRQSTWREWASGVGVTTSEQKQLSKMYESGQSMFEIRRDTTMDQAVEQYYTRQAAAIKALTAAEDDLILREQKLAFVNKELAAGLTTASANALFNYKKDLEALGKSADEVTKRTAAFRAGLVEKQGHSPIKQIADDAAAARKQVDHLARALGPQITDIFVGLATGQSPMMVLLQQGGQLRDQLALAGVESNKMGEALKTSASYMVTSVSGVAVAIGQLFGGAIVGAGKKVVELATAMTFTTGLFNEFKLAAAIGADAGDKFYLAMYNILRIAPVVIGLMASYAAIMTGALLVAYFKVSKEVDNLTKSLILNGGSLALTKDSAIALARSLEETGVSVSQVVEVMTAMAKEGGFVKSEIETVTKAAVDMQKYGGVAVEDTVKSFAKMKDEPVKALLELAKNTGLVTDETVKMVIQLEEQGKKSEAAALAIKALADVNAEQVSRMKQDYSDLGIMLINVKTWFDDLWNGIKGVVYEPTAIEKARKALQDVGNQIVETEENLKASRGLGITTSDSRLNQLREQFKLRQQEYEQLLKNRDAEEATRKANSEASKIRSDNAKLTEQYNTQIEKSGKLIKQYTGEIDANIEKINKGDANSALLSERNVILRKAIREEEKKIADAQKKDNAESLSAAKKLEEQRKKDLNVYEDIMNKSEGLNKAYNDSVDALTRSVKVGDITQQEYTAAFQALYEQQPGYIKQQQEMKKGVDDLNKSTTDFNNKILESQVATAKEREELASMTAMLGMTEEQQKTYTIEYQKSLKLKQLDIDLEKELRAIRQDPSIADNPYIQYDREQKAIQANAAKRQLVEDQASYEIAKKQAEEFKKVQDDISGIIADALFEGGKKGADSLKNYLKTTFRKFVIDVIINPIVGSLMGASGVQGASGSLLGNMGSSLLSNAVTGISGVASAFGTAFSNAALSTVQGWVGMSGTAAQMGTSLANAGYYAGSAAGTTASGIGASIGAYAPYALAAVVALDQLGILDRWSGDPDAFLVQQATGTTQRYRTSTTSRLGTVGFVNGNATIMRNGRLVSEYGETEDVSRQFQNAALATIQALDNAIAENMSEQQIRQTSEMLSGWFKKSWSFSGGMLEGWLTSRYELILQSLDSTFGKVKDYQKEGEKLTDTTIRLITNLTTVRNTFDSLGISADTVTAKFATNLTDMLGGISNLSSSMQFFYENFFSEEEKMQRATEGLTKAFAAMNLTVPETKQQFRELLEGALSSGNLGLSASLIALMQPFNDFIAANEELAQSVNETVDSIQQEINRLRGENLTDSIVQGTALRAEFDIMSALARGGDITALAKLPEYSQAIEKNMTDFASSASDVIFARALLAQSLSDTMSSLGGNTTIVPTSVSGLAGSTSIATTGAADLTASVTSQGDLVSVLIAEIQGLRAEVRADVSANTKTSKILERANQDGETLSVTVVA